MRNFKITASVSYSFTWDCAKHNMLWHLQISFTVVIATDNCLRNVTS